MAAAAASSGATAATGTSISAIASFGGSHNQQTSVSTRTADPANLTITTRASYASCAGFQAHVHEAQG